MTWYHGFGSTSKLKKRRRLCWDPSRHFGTMMSISSVNQMSPFSKYSVIPRPCSTLSVYLVLFVTDELTFTMRCYGVNYLQRIEC